MPLAKVLPYGAAVGLIAGLVGAGGGFLVVPALALLGGLAMPAAVGTSLLVIALQSFAGFTGHVSTTTIPWTLAIALTAAAVAGGALGARWAGRVHPERLRRWFGWLVLAMAGLVLGQQLPPTLRTSPLLWTIVGVAAATVILALTIRHRQHGDHLRSSASLRSAPSQIRDDRQPEPMKPTREGR
jgi:peptidoglycan/LPS O-acetylase OafA/YrhL